MKIVIGGTSGFIGQVLVARLVARGDDVVRLVRRPAGGAGEMQWDPAAGFIEAGALEGADAIINLGGVGIGDRRWDREYKDAILDSRVMATSTLASAAGSMSQPPGIFVSASAIGFYGDRGDETLTEESLPGPMSDHLVHVSQRWEAAASPVADAGVPLAFLRTGIVLGAGGVVGRLLLPFKLGVGGRMGDGKQWWSWVSLEDQVSATLHVIDGKLSGPFNVTAPNPVRNSEFAKSLGKALYRPTLVPTPAFALKALLGAERAEALIFTSARVLPAALEAAGFEFKHKTLEEAWPAVLAKK